MISQTPSLQEISYNDTLPDDYFTGGDGPPPDYDESQATQQNSDRPPSLEENALGGNPNSAEAMTVTPSEEALDRLDQQASRHPGFLQRIFNSSSTTVSVPEPSAKQLQRRQDALNDCPSSRLRTPQRCPRDGPLSTRFPRYVYDGFTFVSRERARAIKKSAINVSNVMMRASEVADRSRDGISGTDWPDDVLRDRQRAARTALRTATTYGGKIKEVVDVLQEKYGYSGPDIDKTLNDLW